MIKNIISLIVAAAVFSFTGIASAAEPASTPTFVNPAVQVPAVKKDDA